MRTRDLIVQTLENHSRHPKQSDVWLPMVRCRCGEVMMSNRYRHHLADRIVEVLT